MSYDFDPENPPSQGMPEVQNLADWCMRMFQEVSDNLINKRAGFSYAAIAVDQIGLLNPKPPRAYQIADDGAGSTGVYARAFDADKEKEALFSIPMPPDRAVNANLGVSLVWMPSTANSGNVVWTIEYTVANLGEAVPNTQYATVVAAADGATFLPVFDIVDARGRGGPINSMPVVFGRLFRDAKNPLDTYPDEAVLISIDVQYIKASLGLDKALISHD